MVAPTQENTVEDMEIVVPDSGGEVWTIPAGAYPAELVRLKRVPKPDWKLKGTEETDDDKHQLEWGFRITSGEYEGVVLTDYTNISWHPKATAHKHAAALLGVPELAIGVGLSTGQLKGKPCQIWVIEKPLKNKPDEFRNYVEKVTIQSVARPRPQRQQAERVQLDGFPGD